MNSHNEKQHWFESLIEYSRDAIIGVNLGGAVQIWNKAAARIFGVSPEQALGRPLSALFSANCACAAGETIEKLKRGEHPEPFETTCRCCLAQGINLSMMASPVTDDHGQVTGFMLIGRDITARLNAEEALVRSEARLRALFERAKLDHSQLEAIINGLSQAIFVANTEGRIISMNPAAYRLTGLPENCDLADHFEHRTELYEARYPDGRLIPPEDWPLERAKRGESVNDFEIHVRRRDTDKPWIGLYSSFPVRNSEGHIALTIIAMQEITELKKAEQAQREASERLIEADRRKSEFLAMLGHELRNPLAPIRNSLALLRMQPEPVSPVLRRGLDIIERQADQLARLVNELLDVARVTRGRIHLRKQQVFLADVIASAVETASPLLDAKRQRLIVESPPEKVRLEADPVRLAQAIASVMDNASKYTGEGGRIWVEAGREGSAAVVKVRDEGRGIAPELLPHIFDLFAQADQPLDRTEGGLGLGLTLVRTLIQMHGGMVEAHSAGVGQGSEFILRLPALAEVADQVAKPKAEPQGFTRRILVVDDLADAAESLADLLRILGHEVRTARDGPAALEAMTEFRPDVVLLDIGLPGMDGYEVARRMRQQSEAPPVRIIALSGYGQDGDHKQPGDAGFDQRLVKPVDLDALKEILVRPA